MLAASEPKIHLLSKCVPSVVIVGGMVFRSEEQAVRTGFCCSIPVGSCCRFQLSSLHMLLPSPRRTPGPRVRLTWKSAACTAPPP